MMETRKHIAVEKNRQGTHNCAQAVLCTYCDFCGLDPKVAEDIAGSFGLDDSVYGAGDYVRYWSRLRSDADFAYYLYFDEIEYSVTLYYRGGGLSIRPVLVIPE